MAVEKDPFITARAIAARLADWDRQDDEYAIAMSGLPESERDSVRESEKLQEIHRRRQAVLALMMEGKL